MTATAAPKHILYAYDGSGSTAGVNVYHAVSERLLADIQASGVPFTIVHWNHDWQQMSADDLLQIHRRRHGVGGTNIDAVATAIGAFRKSVLGGKLVLLTDGEVDAFSVGKCDRLLTILGGGAASLFASVDVHIVSNTPNLSVSCPFTRRCPHTIAIYDPSAAVAAASPAPTETIVVSEADIETLATLDGIATVDAFDAHYDAILRALRARQMGRPDADTALHDQITRLRGRLVADAARRAATESADITERLIRALANAADAAVGHYRDAVTAFYRNADGGSVERRIGALLNITAGGLRNDFSHRLRRAEELVGPDLSDIAPAPAPPEPPTEEAAAPFVCPIFLEDESDVAILVRDGPPLLIGDAAAVTSAAVLEDLMTSPLSALRRPDLCSAIAARLDIAVSLSAIKASDRLAPVPCLVQSPYTREPITGALYLGANDSQARATDATIARLLVGGGAEGPGRRVGNMDLWAAVLWRILADRATPAARRLADESGVLAALERHLRWRLAHRTTYASLSGLSGYYNVRVPLGVACWMVAAAPLLGLPAKRDVTRLHAFQLPTIYDLVRLSGFQLPNAAALDHYRARLVCLFKCSAWAKAAAAVPPSVAARALYQRCVRVQCPPYWVPIDGPADVDQIAAVRAEHFVGADWDALSDAEIVEIVAAAREPNVAVGSIELPFGAAPPALPPSVVRWPGYGLSTQTRRVVIPICPATGRPYYTTPPGTWKEAVTAAYGVAPTECLSANERYVRFVARYGRFPATTDEFVAYLYQSYSGGAASAAAEGAPLPAPVVQFAEETLETHAPLIAAGMTPAEFTERAERSRPIDQRIAIEAAVA